MSSRQVLLTGRWLALARHALVGTRRVNAAPCIMASMEEVCSLIVDSLSASVALMIKHIPFHAKNLRAICSHAQQALCSRRTSLHAGTTRGFATQSAGGDSSRARGVSCLLLTLVHDEALA